jgi:putative transposase
MITIKERKLIIQWDEKGITQQEIAELLNCHQTSVSRFLNKYKRKGTVENLPRSGRPTKLTKEVLSQLKEKIQAKIKRINNKFCSISTKEIGEFIHKEIGKEYTLRHIERIMHQLGFSLITPRPQHIRHNQEKVDKFRAEFKKNSNKSTWVMS